LDDTDLVIQAFHESKGDLVIRMAVTDDSVPVAFHESSKLLEGFKPLPAQLAFPAFKELSGLGWVVVIPELPERFFQQIGFMKPFVFF
jgi:hypothetical protein